LWSYAGTELCEQRILLLEEYKPSFVKWAGRYIDEDPVVLASQGLSIAGAATAKLRRALSEASKEEEKERSEKDKMRRGGKLYRVFVS
jgi:hypothetical protein